MKYKTVMVMIIVQLGMTRCLSLSDCERSIYYCCDPKNHVPLPFRCFEVNNCPGLYWQGKTICSEDINKIDVSSKSSYKPIPKRIPRKLKKMKQLQKMKMRSVKCSTAIVECCTPDSPLSLPMRCLEK